MNRKLSDKEIQHAFNRQIVQLALLHRVGVGLDPVVAARLQSGGFLTDATAEPFDIATLEAVTSSIRQGQSQAAGPLLFVRDGATTFVIELATLLVHSDINVRRAAIEYYQASNLSNRWTSDGLDQLVKSLLRQLESELEAEWRKAGLNVAEAIRNDFVASIAALSQSIAMSYKEGVDSYTATAMRPTFKLLNGLLPPLWSPSEQEQALIGKMDKLAGSEVLEDALDSYMAQLGLVPLGANYSAATLVSEWIRRHPGEDVSWDRICKWADMQSSIVARYHALAIALSCPNIEVTETPEQFGKRLLSIIDVRFSNDAPSDENSVWLLHCETAAHFCNHVETLHPGQNGERIACYAWWLTAQIAPLLTRTNGQAITVLQTTVRPHANFSNRQRMISRSQVVPSTLHYMSSYSASVWSASLLVQLKNTHHAALLERLPEDMSNAIGKALRGYLITSCIAEKWKDANIFAFCSSTDPNELQGWATFLSESEREAFGQLNAFRSSLHSPDTLGERLDGFLDLPIHEQHFLLIFLAEAVQSTGLFESAIEKWLSNTERLAKTVSDIHIDLLPSLLKALAAIQYQRRLDQSIVIPHVLAYLLNSTEVEERARLIIEQISLMSINAGIASPIHRMSVSRWSAIVLESTESLRTSLLWVASEAEPWLAARIRDCLATISRLIGPRQYLPR